jgi:PAS domain-containing protein
MREQQGEPRRNLLDDYKARYQILADNTYDWEFWLSPEGRYLYVSPSSKRITGHGLSRHSAGGRDDGSVFVCDRLCRHSFYERRRICG